MYQPENRSLPRRIVEAIGSWDNPIFRRVVHHALEINLDLYQLRLPNEGIARAAGWLGFKASMHQLWDDARLMNETGLNLQAREAAKVRLEPVRQKLLQAPRDHVELALSYARTKMSGNGEVGPIIAHYLDVPVEGQNFHILAVRVDDPNNLKDAPTTPRQASSEEIIYVLNGDGVVVRTTMQEGNNVLWDSARIAMPGEPALVYRRQRYSIEYGGNSPLEFLLATPDSALLPKK